MSGRSAGGASLEEIEALYRSHLDDYRGVAAAILRDRFEAVDVVQEAFALAVRKRSSFRGEGELAGWVWQIVVRAALNQRKKRGPLPVELPDGRREPAASNGRGGDDERLDAALALLPERQRVAIFLRYYADLDYGTIAAILRVAPGTVSATIHAAHRALHSHLEGMRR